MCGIAGTWWRGAEFQAQASERIVRGMADALVHRGPDSSGHWIDAAAGLALGHRRLAVLDLSAAGRQPMASASGRFVVVFNGEVYNHLDLRRQLEAEGRAPSWRGLSDTESMLACVESWGVERTLERLNGMFAFGLWDRRARALVLARDRIGEKPVYYGRFGPVLAFGSELKALRAHPAFDRQIDRSALALLLRYNTIPAPRSIFAGIAKLPPGTWVRLTSEQIEWPAPVPYWSLCDVAEAGERTPFVGSEDEAASELEALLSEVVRSQMLSDVPLGAFLSGGVDSSTIVAMMRAHSSCPVRTFSIGFQEVRFNEAPHAAAVARHLGTDHAQLMVTEADALAVVPRLGGIFDEPFADSSQIPTVLLSQLTRRRVTVAMSGDGGDELFGGYNRYLWGPRVWQKATRIPAPFRRALGAAVARTPSRLVGDGLALINAAMPWLGLPTALETKARKLGVDILGATTLGDLYDRIISGWPDAEEVVLGLRDSDATGGRMPLSDLRAPEAQMMALDATNYLPDDILVKLDRSAMAASLETRLPFLDRRIVEFAWRLPLAWKIQGGTGKHLLRRVLYRHVPAELIERPKQGFAIPLDDWLRGGLRDWAEDLLSDRRLAADAMLDPEPIRAIWQAHCSGRYNFGTRLWSVLMFQAWRTYAPAEIAPA